MGDLPLRGGKNIRKEGRNYYRTSNNTGFPGQAGE
jgi:hypothetical protein